MSKSNAAGLSLLILAFLFATASGRSDANPPSGFQSKTLLIDLNEPTALTFLPDGRMLILERGGTIVSAQPGATQIDPVPVLTLPNATSLEGERGLVGITLDPAFASNGFFYVFYTAATPLVDRVSRFTLSGATADPASEQVIWQDNEPSDFYHHGGCVGFGPDGKLYISCGDFSQAHSQAMNLSSYRGKILRVNPDGTIPTDNPFYDGAGPNLDEIWAIGLRNPFRFTFDAPTGKLYIGDVGANNNETSIEEINLGAPGANYGWPKYEGPANTPGITDPLYYYGHSGLGAAVVTGFVYRGTQFPAQYQGSLFFSDYVRSWIKRLTLDPTGTQVTGTENFEPGDGANFGPYGNPVDLQQGPDGALYYIDIGNPYVTPVLLGTVRQISYIGTSQQPPVAVASSDMTLGTVPLTVQFASLGSSDPQGQPLTFLWDFGNGQTSTQANPVMTYNAKGVYIVRLTVSDGTLSAQAAPLQITAGIPPVISILTPTSGTLFHIGDRIHYAATATDDNGTTLSSSHFTWVVRMLHDTHIHPFYGPMSEVASGSFPTNIGSHGFPPDTRLAISVTARDDQGLAATALTIVYPYPNPSGVKDALPWLDPRL